MNQYRGYFRRLFLEGRQTKRHVTGVDDEYGNYASQTGALLQGVRVEYLERAASLVSGRHQNGLMTDAVLIDSTCASGRPG